MPVLYRTLSAFRKAPMHRSLRFAVSTLKNRLRKPLCAALAIWVFPVAAQAPSVETLAAQADAVLVVEMAFVPYGDLVLTREILHGDKNSLPDASEFLGACLPGKAGVRQLANQVVALLSCALFAVAVAALSLAYGELT